MSKTTHKRVEWPEGWGVDSDGDIVVKSGSLNVCLYRVSMMKDFIEKILIDGPYILENLDELRGYS